MKLHCSTRRRSTFMLRSILTTTATIMMQKQHYHSIVNITSTVVVGRWLVVNLLKTTASAILATTTTTTTHHSHNPFVPRGHASANPNSHDNDMLYRYLYSDHSDSCGGSSSSNNNRVSFGRRDNHYNENYSFGSTGSDNRASSNHGGRSLPLVTSWSPSTPFRSSTYMSSKLIRNQQQHNHLFSTTSATTVSTTNTEGNSDMEVIESSIQTQQQHYHGGSRTKRIAKAAPAATSTSAPPPVAHERKALLSSTGTNTSPLQQQQPTSAVQEYNISLRLASLSDIASISSCNIQTLPENYNDMFYMNHINEYPYLSLVAVIDEPTDTMDDDSTTRQSRKRQIHGNYEPNPASSSSSSTETPPPTNPKLNFIQRHLQMSKRRFATTFWTPQQQYGEYNSYMNYHDNKDMDQNIHTARTTSSKSIVVGYLLGKITAPQEPYQFSNYQNDNNNYIFGTPHDPYHNNVNHQIHHRHFRSEPPHEMIGHVSSLAVLPEARRRGLARALLEQFHHHLSTMGSSSVSLSSTLSNQKNRLTQNDKNIVITSTGLHVRCSNLVAVQLYETLGYTPAVTIPAYYEDGENAYYMQKIFVQPQQNNNLEGQRHKLQDDVYKKQQNNRDAIARSNGGYQLPRVISVLSLSENDTTTGNLETKRDGSNKDDDEIRDGRHSNTNNIVHEEEEEEQMLMNGTV